MADRFYSNAVHGQNFDAATVYKGFDRIAMLEYGNAQEQMIGEELYGGDDLGTEGLHNEVFFRTRLQGQAMKMDDRVRQRFPMADYKQGSILIHGYARLGIADMYFPEDLEDNLPGFEFIANLAADLSILLRDAEEDEYLNLYNNGETISGGHAATPLFVDGSTHKLQLIGNPTYFSGTAASNIMDNAGGISYSLISLLRQYGRNFVNEEGRTNPVEMDRIVCNQQNGDLLELYFSATTNIEQTNPEVKNPQAGKSTPTILRTERLSNPNDLIVFYTGWQDQIKERNKYRGRTDSWEEGNAQFRKVYTQMRSRYGFYFYGNRLVVLVRGAN